MMNQQKEGVTSNSKFSGRFKVIKEIISQKINLRYISKGQRPDPDMSVFLFIVVTCLLSVGVLQSFPLTEDLEEDFSEDGKFKERLLEEGEMFEGDIILRPEQLAHLQTKHLPVQSVKTLIADPTAIWPNKTVPYQFAPGEFSSTQQARIVQALSDLMSVSCVRFIPRTNHQAYLVLRNNGLGCAAAVGYHNFGPLDLFLGGPSCQTRGTIQHEFLHALGFWHEHTRQDRDQHITIIWSNISPGKEFNFYKREPSEIMNLNLPYDYNSVMHYRSIAFSKDMRSTTIIPKLPRAAVRMGQRIRFSQLDLAKLNRLYQCPPMYYHGDDVIKRKTDGENEEDIDPVPDNKTQEEMDKELLLHQNLQKHQLPTKTDKDHSTEDVKINPDTINNDKAGSV